MSNWWAQYLSSQLSPEINPTISQLYAFALKDDSVKLSSTGALCVMTGKFTGRAADDKYVVEDSYSKERIDWTNNVRSITSETFTEVKNYLLNYLSDKKVYAMERSVGADTRYALSVRLLTPSPTHALFSRHMFREPLATCPLGNFTIIHAPHLELDHVRWGLRSGTAIMINLTSREILIAGTAYAGEIKKSIFSIMNVLLPEVGVFPMHSGANVDAQGRVSVFFGLSGTGKTTLSTDVGLNLIGDDEHGLSKDGTFNIEGGCYAKTYKLKEESEPQVYRGINRFGSMMENVKLDKSDNPIFDDKSVTENGRGTYPLTAIDGSVNSGCGAVPQNIFFLSADAMGVLPAVSLLDTKQAMYYFLSGYTAKLAGTELGLKGIKTAFSHCFGAPFMMRKPKDYSDLLKKFITEYPIKVWLINTGWSAGPYGVGERYDIPVTRSIIRGIQKGDLHNVKFTKDPFFGLSVPESIPGVDKKLLNPKELWADKGAYDDMALKLKCEFENNFKKFGIAEL